MQWMYKVQNRHEYMLRRMGQNDENTSSRTNYRYLTTPEKNARLRGMKESLKWSRKHVESLKVQLDEYVHKRGGKVDGNIHHDLLTIMKDNEEYILINQHQPGQYFLLYIIPVPLYNIPCAAACMYM